MSDKVTYNGKNVTVPAKSKKSSTVYAHPGDLIQIDSDISGLYKEIVKGDLVIYMLNGTKITISNYALMLLEKDYPVLKDINRTYTKDELLVSKNALLVKDYDLKQVVTRHTSTIDNITEQPGDYLSTIQEKINSIYAKQGNTGKTPTKEDDVLRPASDLTAPYSIKTLGFESNLKLDIDEVYMYNGKTTHNQDQIGDDESLYDLVRPNIEPVYGVRMETGGILESGTAQYVKMMHGGGLLQGDAFAHYQYEPEVKSFLDRAEGITYEGDTTGTIYRGLYVSVRGAGSKIQYVRIYNLPEGVSVVESAGQVVTPTAAGSYKITAVGGPSGLILRLKYDDSIAPDLRAVEVSIEGENSQTNTNFSGSTTFQYDTRVVNSVNDILNFSEYNTFTFSSRIDPLIVKMTNSTDVVRAGKNYNTEFYMGGGDDIFYQGETGMVKVHLETGSNKIYIGTSNGIIDATERSATDDTTRNYIYLMDGIDILQDGSSMSLRSGGKIDIVTISKGTTYKNIAQYITDIYLDNREGRDKVINIDSTAGHNRVSLHGMGGNNTINFTTENNVLIDLHNAGSVAYVSTNNGADKVYLGEANASSEKDMSVKTFNLQKASSALFKGSLEYDAYVTFKQGGGNIASYSDVPIGANQDGIVYYADDFENYKKDTVLKINSGKYDVLSNITTIYGTQGRDLFYGSGSGDGLVYYGYTAKGFGQSTLSYEHESQNGVEIDFTQTTGLINGVSEIPDIVVKKSNGKMDAVYNVDVVKASNADDTFYLSNSSIYDIDGLKGTQDKLSYIKGRHDQGITINVNERSNYGASGTVVKASGAYTDKYTNINILEGTAEQKDIYNINVIDQNLVLTGNSYSTLNYYSDEIADLILDIANKKIIKPTGNDSFGQMEAINLLNKANSNTLVIDGLETLNLYIDHSIDLGGSGKNVVSVNKAITNNTFLSILTEKVVNYSVIDLKETGNILTIPTSGSEVNKINSAYDGVRENHLLLNLYDEALIKVSNLFEGKPQLYISGTRLKVPVQELTTTGFTKITGASVNNTFIENADENKSISYKLGTDGSSLITLDYSSTVNEYLVFDFANIDSTYKVTVNKGGTKDYFASVSQVQGGMKGNKFILNPQNENINIIGGTGYDTISYENYLSAITDLPSAIFDNIDQIQLTNFNDKITQGDTFFANKNKKYTVDAGGGDKNTFELTTKNEKIHYYVGVSNPSNPSELVIKLAPTENAVIEDSALIKNFQMLSGSKSYATEFHVKVSDNAKVLDNEKIFYYVGQYSNNKDTGDFVSYEGLKSGVTLDFLNTGPMRGLAVANAIKVTKENNSIDYIYSISKILLSEQVDNTVRLDLSYVQDYKDIHIDMGVNSKEGNILDLAEYNQSILFDFTKLEINNQSFDIKNYNKIVATSGEDTYIFADKEAKNYYIINKKGLNGFHKADYSNVSEDLKINYDASTSVATISRGSANDVLNYFSTFIGGKGNNIFQGSQDSNVDYTGNTDASRLNQLSYETDTDADSAYTFSLDLSKRGGSVYKNWEGSKKDTFQNITDLISNNGGITTFNITNIAVPSVLMHIDGQSGDNSLLFSDLKYTGGLIFNFSADTIYENKSGTIGGAILGFKNIQSIRGTSNGADIFVLSPNDKENNLFTNKATIDGGSQSTDVSQIKKISDSSVYQAVGNIIDMQQMGGNGTNYSVDLSTSKIQQLNNSEYYFTYNNIHTIILSKGNDTVILGGGAASTIKKIFGGEGTNTISFQNSISPITGDINNLNVGGQSIFLDQFEVYKLTNYNDNINVTYGGNNNKGIVVDGGDGEDTINYVGFKSVVIDVYTGEDVNNETGWFQVSRGDKQAKDKIKNFNIINLDDNGVNTINLGNEENAINIFGGKENTLGFKNYTLGTLSINLETGVIERLHTATSNYVQNKIQNVKNLSLGDTNAEVNLTNSIAGNKITSVSIDVSDQGKKTFLFSKGTLDYAETATGAVASIVDPSNKKISYDISGTSVKVVHGGNIGNTFHSMLRGTTFIGNTNKDIIDYSNIKTDGLNVDFGNMTISSKDVTNTNVDNFENILKVIGLTSGNNSFLNLSNSKSYSITAGGSNNEVLYSASSVGLTFIITKNKTKIYKDGYSHSYSDINIQNDTGILDNLFGIDRYTGSNLDDTFIIDLDYFVSHPTAKINGGKQGNNTLQLFNNINPNSNLDLVFASDGSGKANNIAFSVENFNNFKLSDYNDKVTINPGSIRMGFDGVKGDNTFVFNNQDTDSNSVINYNYEDLSSQLSGTSSKGNYSIQFNKFQNIIFEGNNSAGSLVFILNNYAASAGNNYKLNLDFSKFLSQDGKNVTFSALLDPNFTEITYKDSVLSAKNNTLSVKDAGQINLSAPTSSSSNPLLFNINGASQDKFSTVSLNNGYYNIVLGNAVTDLITLVDSTFTVKDSQKADKLKVSLSNIQKASIQINGDMDIGKITYMFHTIKTTGSKATFNMSQYQGALGSLLIQDDKIVIDKSMVDGINSNNTDITKIDGFSKIIYYGHVNIQSLAQSVSVIGNDANIANIFLNQKEKIKTIEYSNISNGGNDVNLNINKKNNISLSHFNTLNITQDHASSIDIQVVLSLANEIDIPNFLFSEKDKAELTIISNSNNKITITQAQKDAGIAPNENKTADVIQLHATITRTGFLNISGYLNSTAITAQNASLLRLNDYVSASPNNTIIFNNSIDELKEIMTVPNHIMPFIARKGSVMGKGDHSAGVQVNEYAPTYQTFDFRNIIVSEHNKTDALYLMNTFINDSNRYDWSDISIAINGTAAANQILRIDQLKTSTIYLPNITSIILFSAPTVSTYKHIYGSETADSMFIFKTYSDIYTAFLNKSQNLHASYTTRMHNINIVSINGITRASPMLVARDGFNTYNNNVVSLFRDNDTTPLSFSVASGSQAMSETVILGLVLSANVGEVDKLNNLNPAIQYNAALLNPYQSLNESTGKFSQDYINAVKALLTSGKYYLTIAMSDMSGLSLVQQNVSDRNAYKVFYVMYSNAMPSLDSSNYTGEIYFSFGKSANALLYFSQYKDQTDSVNIRAKETSPAPGGRSAPATLTYDAIYYGMELYDGSTLPDNLVLSYKLDLSESKYGNRGVLTMEGFSTKTDGLNFTPSGTVTGNAKVLLDGLQKMTFHNFTTYNFDSQSLDGSGKSIATNLTIITNGNSPQYMNKSLPVIIDMGGTPDINRKSIDNMNGNPVHHKMPNNPSVGNTSITMDLFYNSSVTSGLSYTLAMGGNNSQDYNRFTPITIHNSFIYISEIDNKVIDVYSVMTSPYINFDTLNHLSFAYVTPDIKEFWVFRMPTKYNYTVSNFSDTGQFRIIRLTDKTDSSRYFDILHYGQIASKKAQYDVPQANKPGQISQRSLSMAELIQQDEDERTDETNTINSYNNANEQLISQRSLSMAELIQQDKDERTDETNTINSHNNANEQLVSQRSLSIAEQMQQNIDQGGEDKIVNISNEQENVVQNRDAEGEIINISNEQENNNIVNNDDNNAQAISPRSLSIAEQMQQDADENSENQIIDANNTQEDNNIDVNDDTNLLYLAHNKDVDESITYENHDMHNLPTENDMYQMDSQLLEEATSESAYLADYKDDTLHETSKYDEKTNM